MELVWKNDEGSVLAIHRFSGVDPAVALECQHWALSAGDTIEIRSLEVNEDEVLEHTIETVHLIFEHFQEKYDIETGDISPMQNMKLESEIKALADRITSILQEQKGL